MFTSWYEVWVDEGLDVPYVLLVRPCGADSARVEIIDPFQRCQVVYQAQDYESAKIWLLEDEYTRVEGRMLLP